MRYYFCTAIVSVKTDTIDARHPVDTGPVTTCCAQMFGTIGEVTASNSSSRPGDSAITAGTMGCGFELADAVPGSTAPPTELNWGSCIFEKRKFADGGGSVSCIMASQAILNPMPFNDTTSTSGGSGATVATGAVPTESLKPSKSSAKSNKVGAGMAMLLCGYLALSVLAVF